MEKFTILAISAPLISVGSVPSNLLIRSEKNENTKRSDQHPNSMVIVT